MRTIRQPDGSSCVAACVAMIIDESVDYVLGAVKRDEDGPVPLRQAYALLALHGWCGMAFDERTATAVIRKQNVEIEGMHDHTALVTVDSPLEGKLHLVVYDGDEKCIRDPLCDGVRFVRDYNVKEWSPLIKQSW